MFKAKDLLLFKKLAINYFTFPALLYELSKSSESWGLHIKGHFIPSDLFSRASAFSVFFYLAILHLKNLNLRNNNSPDSLNHLRPPLWSSSLRYSWVSEWPDLALRVTRSSRNLVTLPRFLLDLRDSRWIGVATAYFDGWIGDSGGGPRIKLTWIFLCRIESSSFYLRFLSMPKIRLWFSSICDLNSSLMIFLISAFNKSDQV